MLVVGAEIAQDRIAHVLRNRLGHACPECELRTGEIKRVDKEETVVVAVVSNFQDDTLLDGGEMKHPGGFLVVRHLEDDFLEDLIGRNHDRRPIGLHRARPDVAHARILSGRDLEGPVTLPALGENLVADVIIENIKCFVCLLEDLAVALVQEDDSIGVRILIHALEAPLLRGDLGPRLGGSVGRQRGRPESGFILGGRHPGQDQAGKNRHAMPAAKDSTHCRLLRSRG